MLVSLDGIPLAAPRTGVGHYTFELARSLAALSSGDEFELVSPFEFNSTVQAETGSLPPNLRTVHVEVGPLGRRWFAAGLPLHLRRSRADIFHGTNFEVPLWGSLPAVLTIHDLSLLLHPETHEARLVRRGRLRLPLMARRASVIITASESVRQEICEHLRVDPSKVVTIPDAPRSLFKPIAAHEAQETLSRLGIEEEFILFVGTIEPRKNLPALLRAMEEIIRTTSLRPQLVIAGKEGWLTRDLFSRVERSAVRERLRFTGYLTDEELCHLYSTARAFVYPSLYEGFGLPPLEAMACGAPVITSRIPSIVEAVGTAGSALLVEPRDHEELARTLVEVLEDENLRRTLSLAGRERASHFSWERTARLTLEVYAEVLKKKGERRRVGP